MGMEVAHDADDRREQLALAEAQYEASSTIYGSNDPVEILNALINFGAKAFSDAHLGLLDPETQVLNIIAIRDANGVHSAQATRSLNEYPAHETLSAVEVLYVEDVASDPFLTEPERASIKALNMSAMLIIPLVVAQRLIGLISFTNARPVTVSPLRLRAMRNLGDQIAVVFENQSLLRSTATTLDEVQTLYEINRAMLSAATPLDILRVLRTQVAHDASMINYLSVERSAQNPAEALILRSTIRPETDSEENPEQIIPGMDNLDAVFGKADSTGLLFIEEIDAQTPAIRTLFPNNPPRSLIAIIVREHGQIEDMIGVIYQQPHQFDNRTRRLYNAVADQIGIVMQNQRLLRTAQANAEQLTRQVRVLEGLNRLSSGISNFRTEKELLDYASQSLVDALGVDHVGIVLFEPSDNQGTVISEYPVSQAVGSKVETRTSAMTNTLRDHPERPVIITDIGTDPLIELETRGVLRKLGVVSMMILALQVSGEMIGSVGFDLYARHVRFTPEMVETARTMVAQIAIGVQNIRLLTDEQRRAEQLQRVSTLGQAVQTTLRMDSIINIMLTESSQMIPTDSMSIAFYDAKYGQLRVVGQFSEGKVSVDVQNGPLLAMDGTFVGQVWQTQQMIVIADTHIIASIGQIQDPRLAAWSFNQFDARLVRNISRMQDLSMRSVMVAPINTRARQIGTVSLGCYRPYSYAEADQAIFQQMINQFVVAIENAEAYRQSERAAQNEALINEISTHLQQQGDIEEMLRTAVTELGAALNARAGRIRLAVQPESGRQVN
ncbi:MAG TPA: GAF domain-containing protein [Phototrophicaceae bacterium]|nr:GAF domain-containing protein [Phototrophicaceae bacterium]